MGSKFLVLMSILLVQGTAWAGFGDRIATCASAGTAATKVEVYQMYAAPNPDVYYARYDDGKSVGLIGPDEQTDFNSDRSEMTIDFGALALILKKGIDQEGVIRGLLVPEESVNCTSDWK